MPPRERASSNGPRRIVRIHNAPLEPGASPDLPLSNNMPRSCRHLAVRVVFPSDSLMTNARTAPIHLGDGCPRFDAPIMAHDARFAKIGPRLPIRGNRVGEVTCGTTSGDHVKGRDRKRRHRKWDAPEPEEHSREKRQDRSCIVPNVGLGSSLNRIGYARSISPPQVPAPPVEALFCARKEQLLSTSEGSNRP